MSVESYMQAVKSGQKTKKAADRKPSRVESYMNRADVKARQNAQRVDKLPKRKRSSWQDDTAVIPTSDDVSENL